MSSNMNKKKKLQEAAIQQLFDLFCFVFFDVVIFLQVLNENKNKKINKTNHCDDLEEGRKESIYRVVLVRLM